MEKQYITEETLQISAKRIYYYIKDIGTIVYTYKNLDTYSHHTQK